MGARYYAAWLGRWTSADPMGIGADGPGLYDYCRGSPVTLSDPSGGSSIDSEVRDGETGKIRGREPPGATPKAPAPSANAQAPKAKGPTAGDVISKARRDLENFELPEPEHHKETASAEDPFIEGAKERIEQKARDAIGQLADEFGVGWLWKPADIATSRDPAKRQAELLTGPSLDVDPLSQSIALGKLGWAVTDPTNTGSMARGALAIDIAQQVAGGLILGGAGVGAPGEGPADIPVPEATTPKTRLGLGLGESARSPRPGYRQWSKDMGFQTWDEMTPEMAETHGDLERVRKAMQDGDELHFNMEDFKPKTPPRTETSGGAPVSGSSWTDLEYALARLKYRHKTTFWNGTERYRGSHPY